MKKQAINFDYYILFPFNLWHKSMYGNPHFSIISINNIYLAKILIMMLKSDQSKDRKKRIS